MQSKVLYNQDGHQWIVIGRDPEKDSHVIDTNEYVIINRGHAMLLDPGGIQIFPQVLAELAKYVRMQDIKVTITGIIPTLLNFGTIRAQTASAAESNFTSPALPDPRGLQSLIQTAMDARLQSLGDKPIAAD